jgi:hypothetical protein
MNTRCSAILRCNKCENVFETDIWTEITTGEDHNLDNKIFNDEINFIDCEACGNIGFVLYPVKVTDSASGEKALVIPFMDPLDMTEYDDVSTTGFSVLEVQDKEPCSIFYSFDELKWHIHRWQGGYDAVFDPPPAERDIVEGVQRGIISEAEAALLRNTDWDAILAEMLEQGADHDGEYAFGDERDEAVELYMKLMSELRSSRKVVRLKRRI